MEKEEGEGGGRGRRERGIVVEEGEREDLQITYKFIGYSVHVRVTYTCIFSSTLY